MCGDLRECFLRLVQLGIGQGNADDNPNLDPGVFSCVDWEEVKALAEMQGLSAVVADGIELLRKDVRPPKPVLLQLIGDVLQNYEYRHELYRRAIAELAGFYNSHGFKMMVLKGYACAMDWPKPEHRPSGDIDIWLFGQQKIADAALISWSKDQGSKLEIDNSHHHHTVFYWRNFMVENHYDFINVHHHRSNATFELILKKLGEDDSHFVELYGEKVYLPSPDLHALFMLKHMMLHFASGELLLRQLLDWGFFVKAHGDKVDWPYVTGVLEKFGMTEMSRVFNAICVEDLGFTLGGLKAYGLQFAGVDKALKERVLNEILSPEFTSETPSALLPRIAFKYRRWKANGWKHRLCYRESMWGAFWSGVWSHLLKPSSL